MDVARNQPTIDPDQEQEIQNKRRKQLEQNSDIQSQLEKTLGKYSSNTSQNVQSSPSQTQTKSSMPIKLSNKINDSSFNSQTNKKSSTNVDDSFVPEAEINDKVQMQEYCNSTPQKGNKKKVQVKNKKYSIDSNLKGDLYNIEKEFQEEYEIEQANQPNIQNQFQNFRDSSQDEMSDKNSGMLDFSEGECNLYKKDEMDQESQHSFDNNNKNSTANKRSVFYKQKLEKCHSSNNFEKSQDFQELMLKKGINDNNFSQQYGQIVKNDNMKMEKEDDNSVGFQGKQFFQKQKDPQSQQEYQSQQQQQQKCNNTQQIHFKSLKQIAEAPKRLEVQSNEKIIQKQVHGVTIIDIHQLQDKEFFKAKFFSQNFKNVKNEILKSFRNLHNNYAQSNQYLKIIQFEINKLKDQQAHFSRFSINTQQWPFVVSFTLNLQIQVSESFNSKKKVLFCEEQNVPSHEIFDTFSPNQITMIVQFWNFDDNIEKTYQKRYDSIDLTAESLLLQNYDFQNFKPQFNTYYNESNQMEEEEQNKDKQQTLNQKKIEINYYDFQESYKELMNLGEGSFGKVDLYYDFKNDQLVALKTYTDLKITVKEKEEEMQNLMQGFEQDNQFNDTQIQGESQKQQRNVIREIKQLLELNNAQTQSTSNNNKSRQKQEFMYDDRRKYVLQVKGVVPIPKYNNRNLQEKLAGPAHKKYKGIKLCLNFFGGCEYQNKKLTCDVRHYLKNNSKFLFGDDDSKKLKFVNNIFCEILKAFSFVHDHNVVLRDFKDDNILIRRRYDPQNLGQSIYEIQFCDFGMSKKKKKKSFESHQNSDSKQSSQQQIQQQQSSQYSRKNSPIEEDGFDSFKLTPLTRENSIPYNSINRFRHPRFYKALLENKTIEYEKKDDIFGLGIFLFKLYEEHLNLEFDQQTKDLIEYLTGFSFEITEKYYKNHIIDYNQACQQLLDNDCKNWLQCWERIPHDIQEILNSPVYLQWAQECAS